MEQKICLDTDICIEIIKDTPEGRKALDMIENYEIFLSSVSVFELYLRDFNLDKIDFFLEKVNILNFDGVLAKNASYLVKDLRERGSLIDFRDVFIAASCIMNDCGLLTLNKKHFERIRGLKLLGV